VTPPSGLVIRRGQLADAPLLAALAARTFRDAFGADNSPENLALHLRTHYTPERMAEELADPDWTTLLAQVDGVAAGYAQLLTREPPVTVGTGGLMLHRFYLEQSWIGKGIAQPLMDAVRASALERKARFLWLTVWERNPRAIAFYRKSGFAEAGITSFRVGNDAQTDLVMHSPL
jgi:GNAT superfamily N-acetyltransferase